MSLRISFPFTRAALVLSIIPLSVALTGLPATAEAGTETSTTVSTGGKPAKLQTEARHVTAEVISVDHAKREITLKGPDGKVVLLPVGPEVQRFDEVKKGDMLDVDYVEAIAISVHKPDKATAPEGAATVLVRGTGDTPSGRLIDAETVTATVKSIDAKNRKAELIAPDGKIVKVNVAPDVQNLESVQAGDKVVVQVTRTLALAIRRTDKK